MGTLNAVLRLRDLDPNECETQLAPGATAVTIRRNMQVGERPHTPVSDGGPRRESRSQAAADHARVADVTSCGGSYAASG